MSSLVPTAGRFLSSILTGAEGRLVAAVEVAAGITDTKPSPKRSTKHTQKLQQSEGSQIQRLRSQNSGSESTFGVVMEKGVR